MLICIELNIFFSIKGFGVPWDIFVMAESEMQQGQEVVEARQRTHALVARNPQETVRALFESLPDLPATQRLRPSETGLIMVRGRIGGDGARFNLGEMPVARATMQIANGTVGVGYVIGRDHDHAELAALADAMVQDPAWRDVLEQHILVPLAEQQAAREALEARKAAATKVEFFTMVRNRGPK
ncbi:phosphonate C-P lyase system protein PhnG [Sandarakinorhabdus limnophila]|jgi:alpha-D-ribose 1-methylphosphonate 5-triphosphate synthase subunit PhnG|uniref:phosphonate C-P lyase system protein PhnG n=1 Tax=Sandarakinorhabdus limnophila TaxID=210512 RepID=UPI0026F06C16|nr:phosphonate C-P lyase system protein PhnG [Sandarakinorhabdus limnophila]